MAYIIDVEKKTLSPEDWESLEKHFANEGRTKNECQEFRRIIINLDQQELYNNRKHQSHCESLDAYDESTDNCNSRSILEFNSDDPLVNYYCKNPETILIERDTRAQMWRILSELRESYREVIAAYYYLGLTFTQYGRMNSKSPQWAQQLHKRALRSLRTLLEEKYADFVAEVY